MTALPASRLRMTPEDYVAWEEAQVEKHEYLDGEVFAMSGGTAKHALVTANVTGALRNALRGSGCRVYSSDLRIQVAERRHYVYPDISVVCGEPRFLDERESTLVNPTAVVEVLSPSTAAYDRTGKFAAYRRVESLQLVVLVTPDRPAIEAFRRDAAGWVVVEPEADGAVALDAIGAVLRSEDVYEGVALDAGPPGPARPEDG